jgi:hypothetical protein
MAKRQFVQDRHHGQFRIIDIAVAAVGSAYGLFAAVFGVRQPASNVLTIG